MGDKDIFNEYGDLLYRYLLSLCREPILAEELVQETFYQAIKSIKRYDGSCRMSTWLCQIGKHLWLKDIRKKKKNTMVPLDQVDASTMSEQATPEELLLQKELYIRTLSNIHLLQEDSKEVMLLRSIGELSFKEIADIMGKSESWARVTFFRTKQKLVEMEEEK